MTALSAQASDMSGWLLMGLPGAIYLGGMVNIWIAIGLFIGTILTLAGRDNAGGDFISDYVDRRFAASGYPVKF